MSNWVAARQAVDQAVARLIVIRTLYEASALPSGVKAARVRSLDAKIDALRAVHLDSRAHPWVEDGVTS